MAEPRIITPARQAYARARALSAAEVAAHIETDGAALRSRFRPGHGPALGRAEIEAQIARRSAQEGPRRRP
jgi:hypothetical protein